MLLGFLGKLTMEPSRIVFLIAVISWNEKASQWERFIMGKSIHKIYPYSGKLRLVLD